VLCIADDITVYVEVNTMSEAVADHDCKLFSLLQRCRDRNLNKEKIRLLLPEVQLVGHFITKYGLKPDLANELTLQCDALDWVVISFRTVNQLYMLVTLSCSWIPRSNIHKLK